MWTRRRPAMGRFQLTPPEWLEPRELLATVASAPSQPDVEYVDLYVLNKGLLENTDDPVSHLAWEVHLVQAVTISATSVGHYPRRTADFIRLGAP